MLFPVLSLKLGLMLKKRLPWIVAFATTVIMWLLSLLTQKFIFTEIEESFIFLWNWKDVSGIFFSIGGFAVLVSSFFTQFMIFSWVGPVLAALCYGFISLSLCKVGVRKGRPLWLAPLCVLPCVLLFLCLENNAYKFQGHIAFVMAAGLFWAYASLNDHLSSWGRLILGCLLSLCVYMLAGTVGFLLAASILVYDFSFHQKQWLVSIVPIALVSALAWVCFRLGYTPTLKSAFAPAMYYLWDSTTFMLNYAWGSMVVLVALERVFANAEIRKPLWRWCAVAATVLVVVFVGIKFFGLIHNGGSYQVKMQRYYAKHGNWDAILKMEYDDRGEGTPFTSYRFLALAHKGELSSQYRTMKPYIGYFMTNKKLVKKEDQQILSDIFYDCDYMAAARHAAFDTDIVTPGAFNPYETQKLAIVNIASGDYKVADKLLSQLEKTLFYANWAKTQRKLLWNDEAVFADEKAGAMRRAIPEESNYMSPKGTARDLKNIILSNPNQQIARQFYEVFCSLTNINE